MMIIKILKTGQGCRST